MTAELERLIEAFWRLEECRASEAQKARASYRRLLRDALQKLPPGIDEGHLRALVRRCARQLKAAQKQQFPSVPPKA